MKEQNLRGGLGRSYANMCTWRRHLEVREGEVPKVTGRRDCSPYALMAAPLCNVSIDVAAVIVSILICVQLCFAYLFLYRSFMFLYRKERICL